MNKEQQKRLAECEEGLDLQLESASHEDIEGEIESLEVIKKNLQKRLENTQPTSTPHQERNTEYDHFAWCIGDAILSKYEAELSAPYRSGNDKELNELAMSIDGDQLRDLIIDVFDRMRHQAVTHPGDRLGLLPLDSCELEDLQRQTEKFSPPPEEESEYEGSFVPVRFIW